MKSTGRFWRQLQMLIGTGRFTRAEELIRLFATKLDVPEVIAALDRPADQVLVEEWDTIGFRMEDQKMSRLWQFGGRDWAAVVFALRNDTGVKAPSVEVLFAVSAEARRWDCPTDGWSDLRKREHQRWDATQAILPDRNSLTMDLDPLRLSGLDDLFTLEVGSDEKWNERRACVEALAAGAILLRFHQAVERHATTEGLPGSLPVYATVNSPFNPYESGVRVFGEVARRRFLSVQGDYAQRTAELLNEAANKREAEHVLLTRQLVTEIRERSAVLARWPFWHNPLKRRSFAGMHRLQQKLTRDGLQRMHELDAGRAEGEALARLLVQARHGTVAGPFLEPVGAEDARELHQINMAFAKAFGGSRVRDYLAAHPDNPAIVREISRS